MKRFECCDVDNMQREGFEDYAFPRYLAADKPTSLTSHGPWDSFECSEADPD